jgi:hypothetical protein
MNFRNDTRFEIDDLNFYKPSPHAPFFPSFGLLVGGDSIVLQQTPWFERCRSFALLLPLCFSSARIRWR